MIRRASVLSAAVTAVLALPTAVVFAGGGAAATPVVSSALPAVAASGINVTGAGVATYPAFDPRVSRYAITTGPTTGGTVTVDVSAGPGATVLINGWPSAGPTDVVGLEPGDEVSVIVQDGAESAVYSFVFLPEEFPTLEATVSTPGISEGLVGLTLSKFNNGGPRFETVVDSEGVPAYVFQAPDNVGDLKVQPNGSYSSSRTTTTPGRTGRTLVELDKTFTEIDRHETVGLVDTDNHDSILRPDGSKVLLAYEYDAAADLTDAVIQDLDPAGNVVFEWNSREDLLDETVYPNAAAGDYAHINSLVEMADGDFLASFRHTSSVLKIARTAHDGFVPGDVVWRLGGRNSDFAFADDPFPGGPCAQHTASELPNGNILIYDNGSITGFGPVLCIDPVDPEGDTVPRPNTRVTEYDLGEVDADPTTQETATLVWDYSTGYFGFFAGSAIRRPNGNTLLGFAGVRGAVAREITADGTTVWELRDPAPEGTATHAPYRASVFPAANDLDAIDPSAAVLTPGVGATYAVGQQVYAAAVCTDAGGSTLQSCTGSGELLDTSNAGTKEFRTTAVDGAGNTTTARRTYTVVGGYQPDLRMKIPGNGFVGNDRYGATGQRVVRRVPDIRGAVRTVVKVQNDGSLADSFTVEAAPRRRGFVAKFFAGGRNVTQQVKNGTYRTGAVAPGRTAKIVIKSKRLNRVSRGDRWRQVVKTSSVSEPGRGDRMSHVLKAIG